MKQTIILVILDGWGLGKNNETNPIYIANPQVINYIENNFPAGALQASGISVGLPWEEEGNSEVGHLTIGAGKILYQHFPKISLAIKNGLFFENPVLKQAFDIAKNNNSAVHLVGLLTSGSVHASSKHLLALIAMGKQRYCEKIYLHLFADGKDSPPKSLATLLNNLQKEISGSGSNAVIASVSGRYYAMDRNENWEKTKKTYDVLVGENLKIQSAENLIAQTYAKNLSDEFIEPSFIQEPHPIQSNDSVIFFNFREDSIRQIAAAFLEKNFHQFAVKKLENMFFATMTEYDEKIKTNVVFEKEKVGKPLGQVLAENGKTQLRLAETNKYAHVTYFFNGLREEPYPNEFRILVPTRNVVKQDSHPEMMAKTITDRAILAINENRYDFILINYANADIIAHTGNYRAVLDAVKILNEELGRLLTAAYPQKHLVMITADHGNAEVLLDATTGAPETKHNFSPVPFYLIGSQFKKSSSRQLSITNYQLPVIGLLADVAPTILDIMKIPKPIEMSGQSLLEQLLV